MGFLEAALAGAAVFINENVLLDTVRVALPGGGDPVLNETTGQLDYPEGDILYEGPGAAQPADAASQLSAHPDVLQPWVQETTSRYRLLTPLSAPIFPKDAVVTFVAVHDPANTSLIGRTWVCMDVSTGGTLETVRRTPIDQKRAARAEVTP